MKENKVRLGHCTLEFGNNGSLTDACINEFFGCISAIDVLTVKGLVGELSDNLRYINNKLTECNVFVGQINAEVIA